MRGVLRSCSNFRNCSNDGKPKVFTAAYGRALAVNSFPLGTALLLIIIFGLSGIFSCCYHWDKLRSFCRSFAHTTDQEAPESDPDNSKPKLASDKMKAKQNQSLPVLMPGDQIPKFVALSCPCHPPREGKIIVEVQKPPNLPRIAIPLY